MKKNSLFTNSLESLVERFNYNNAFIMANNSLLQIMNQESEVIRNALHAFNLPYSNLQPFYESYEIAHRFASMYDHYSAITEAIRQIQQPILFQNEQVTEIIQKLNHNPMIESWQKTEAALSALIGNGEINQFFPQAMELTKEIDADSLPEIQMPAIPPKQAESIRSSLPPLNLSERDFQIFLVVLEFILQFLCDMAQSNNADILENQQTQIAIQQEILETQRTQIDLQRQILEELKKSSSARSSNISISHTGNK